MKIRLLRSGAGGIYLRLNAVPFKKTPEAGAPYGPPLSRGGGSAQPSRRGPVGSADSHWTVAYRSCLPPDLSGASRQLPFTRGADGVQHREEAGILSRQLFQLPHVCQLIHDFLEAAACDGADGRGDCALDQRAVGQNKLPLRHGLKHHFRRHDR